MALSAFSLFLLLAFGLAGWGLSGSKSFLDRVAEDGRNEPWKNP